MVLDPKAKFKLNWKNFKGVADGISRWITQQKLKIYLQNPKPDPYIRLNWLMRVFQKPYQDDFKA